jgi:3-deoxy-D-manno-octulosonic-acid transferase
MQLPGQSARAFPPEAGGNLRLLYNLLLTWGLIASLPVSLPVALTAPKRRATIGPRLGLTAFGPGRHGNAAGLTRRVWVHALSVGEVRSAISLVKRWRHAFESEAVVFSASTHTGYKVAQRELGHVVDALCYYPYDLIFAVKRAIRRIAPDAVVLVETDIWPNFLFEMQRRNVPVMLVNAKLSERSWRGYRRLGELVRPLFGTLALVCAQTTQDAERLRQLGVSSERMHVTGNIKFDQPALPVETQDALQAQLNLPPGQGTLVAGSTHPGEETMIEAAWVQLRRRQSGIKLIVAPRDPARAVELRRFFKRSGHNAILLSEVLQGDAGQGYDVLIVDTVGILSRLYALADIAVVGGSLVPFGGHNPLEPAAWSKPIIFGSDMSDFGQIARRLVAGGGALQVSDQDGLTEAVTLLFEDPQRAQAMGQNAYAVFKRNQGAVDRTIDIISAFRKVINQ